MEEAKSNDAIFYFGPSIKIYKYAVNKRAWSSIRIEKKSSYRGNVKHQCCTAIPDRHKIVMTGGVSVATCHPIGNVFEFDVKTLNKGVARGLRNMGIKRYAHAAVYLRGKVIVFGGFGHKDIPEEPP